MKHISSRDNPRFKELNALCGSARDRNKQSLSVLEGVHLAQMVQMAQLHTAATDAALVVHTTAVSHDALADPQIQQWLDQLPDLNDVMVLPETLFRSISQLVQGSSVLQVIHTPRGDLQLAGHADAIYLEDIQDPGNLGSILRTCAAAGLAHIITSPGCADAWSPKALRAGMGAQLSLNIVEGYDYVDLRAKLKTPVMATALIGQANLYQQDLIAPRLWCFGNEGQGLSAQVLGPDAIAAHPLTIVQIPQASRVESLNVGAAVAVCLFEQLRQRTSNKLSA